ncbi:ComF family protein [Microbacteriaceae bacterium]|nr:ComF family protein [Candidatus Saccharibacteria bacterium]
MPYSRAWCVGERKDVLEKLLKSYKFERAKLAYLVIAELLDATIPILPDNTIVVSVPTIRTHIRRRGYDHAALIAKAFAARRKLPYKPILERLNDSVQLGTTKAVRRKQASVAYRAVANNEPNILLIDDVFTTGATAFFAAKALRDAGTESVYMAVLARQPLEKAQ